MNVLKLMLILISAVFAADPQGRYCKGKRQSPIDLNTKDSVPKDLEPLYFNHAFYERPLTQQLRSDGHTVIMTATYEYSLPSISGGPLKKTKYKYHSTHFHWDKSEHTQNGYHFNMEMHAVFTKNGISFDEAKSTPDGLVVLGYFIKQNNKYNGPVALTTIANTMNLLKAINESKPMETRFSLADLVKPFEHDYYTYEGSLTTDNCEEVVTWIVRKSPILVRRYMIEEFVSTYPKLITDQKVYRDVQPLNGRKVVYVVDPYDDEWWWY